MYKIGGRINGTLRYTCTVVPFLPWTAPHTQPEAQSPVKLEPYGEIRRTILDLWITAWWHTIMYIKQWQWSHVTVTVTLLLMVTGLLLLICVDPLKENHQVTVSLYLYRTHPYSARFMQLSILAVSVLQTTWAGLGTRLAIDGQPMSFTKVIKWSCMYTSGSGIIAFQGDDIEQSIMEQWKIGISDFECNLTEHPNVQQYICVCKWNLGHNQWNDDCTCSPYQVMTIGKSVTVQVW